MSYLRQGLNKTQYTIHSESQMEQNFPERFLYLVNCSSKSLKYSFSFSFDQLTDNLGYFIIVVVALSLCTGLLSTFIFEIKNQNFN